MQMYMVTFQANFPDIIDKGKAVVCASDADQAAELVRLHLDLSPSKTTFEVVRVKPSIWCLSRKEVAKHAAAHNHEASPYYERVDGPSIYDVTASGSIKAYSEASAWRRFAEALIDRASASKAIVGGGIQDLEMTCDRKELSSRSPAIDRQAIYKNPRFFAGGSARGK